MAEAVQVKVAKGSGFCFGVAAAVKAVEDALKKDNKKVYCLGALIHNSQVMGKLIEQGLNVVENVGEVPAGATLFLRTHGSAPSIYENIPAGVKVVDTTCKNVRRAQDYVKRLKNEGYSILIVGDNKHPEVQTLKTLAGAQLVQLQHLKTKRVALIPQTTQSSQHLLNTIKQLLPKVDQLHIYNTICRVVERRRTAAILLSKQVDMMVVVGGRNSANTKSLFELLSVHCPTIWVETDLELTNKNFDNIKSVGVVGGTATPLWIIDKVVEYLKKLSF